MTEEEKEFVEVRVLDVRMIQLLQRSKISLFDYGHNDTKSRDLTVATIPSSSITAFFEIASGVVRFPQSSEAHYLHARRTSRKF